MGTRADFYIRNEKSEPKMEWLGSIAWDGYEIDGVEKATTEEEFRTMLKKFFDERDDVTLPEDGWPWPWDDSRTTDYSWVFEKGKVWASQFGYSLYDPQNPPEDEPHEDETKLSNFWPDMRERKNVRIGGKKSGTILVGLNADGSIKSVE
jgi:ABC-type glycerol-3-phosphate transport system substrate-binding protein